MTMRIAVLSTILLCCFNNASQLKQWQKHFLIDASLCGKVITIKQLLASGIDVNFSNGQGYTALHMASAGRWPKTVNFLLKNGADIHQTSNNGLTPLMWVFTMKSKDELQNTCLLSLARLIRRTEKSKSVVELLIEAGVDINAKALTDYGEGAVTTTALMGASAKKNKKEAHLLVNMGATIPSNIKPQWLPSLKRIQTHRNKTIQESLDLLLPKDLVRLLTSFLIIS